MGKWTTIAEAAIEVLASMRRGALPADEAARMARRKRTDDLRAEANALRFGDSYKMQHTAPDAGSSPTGEDLSDVFPDIYGPMGKRYYGTSSPHDDEAISKIQTMRGNPDSEITIYRAVPKDVKEINPGDWVTTTKEYAVDHIGTDDGYTVISKKVKAGELANNGDSIHEFGFSPKALSTDEASRMARAREMGFGPVMYHGSKQDIDEFVPGYDDGLTFLADDPQFANDWIGKGRLRQRIGSEEELKSIEQRYDALRRETIDWEGLNKMPPGDEFSAAYDKAVSEFNSLNELHPRKAYGAVYPVRTNVQNVFDPRKDYAKVEDFLRSEKRGDVVDAGLHKTGNWLVYENKAMVDELKRQGYDAMRIAEKMGDGADGVHGTLAVFDPKNIRSTSAQFDPAKAGSADILAGLGVVGAGAALSQQDGFDYGALSNVVEESNGQISN